MRSCAYMLILGFLSIFLAQSVASRARARGEPLKQVPMRTGPLASKSIEIARRDGCLDGLDGEFEATAKTISSCFAGGFVQDYLIYRKCVEGEYCDLDKAAILAKVRYACSDEPSGSQCLHKRDDPRA